MESSLRWTRSGRLSPQTVAQVQTLFVDSFVDLYTEARAPLTQTEQGLDALKTRLLRDIRLMLDKDVTLLLYEEESSLEGFVGVTLADNNRVRVRQLTVSKRCRKSAVGTKLLKNIELQFPKAAFYGYIQKHNTIGLEFYKTFGAEEGRYWIPPDPEETDKTPENGWILLSFGYIPAIYEVNHFASVSTFVRTQYPNRAEGIEKELQQLLPTGALSPGLESIVKATENPVFFVQKDAVQVPKEHEAAWGFLSSQVDPKILRAIGRIEKIGVDYLGTGWLIAKDLVVTCRHVVDRHLCQEFGGKYKMKAKGQIHFSREQDANPDEGEQKEILEILHLDSTYDVALLRIDSVDRDPIPLSAVPVKYMRQLPWPIGIIGYPDRDGREDRDLQEKVFSKFSVKRFAVGGLVSRQENLDSNMEIFVHDASTLGGNSGSPVVDVKSGTVIGLHFEGRKSGNRAISSTILYSLLECAKK